MVVAVSNLIANKGKNIGTETFKTEISSLKMCNGELIVNCFLIIWNNYKLVIITIALLSPSLSMS